MKFSKLSLALIFYLITHTIKAQTDTTVHRITIKQEMVNKAGKEVMGMTVNGTIPGPTLEFTEGDYAVIYVTNEMDVETSVHWHGLLLPNFHDGVPYLTTPPIKAGTTFKYEFPIKQAGTYWYHSHTMLQEQSGVYGSFVIQPKEKKLEYDKELVVVLSDWTNQKPKNVLRNLKRGNEWYQIAKGTAVPLNRVIKRGALGAQLNFWRQRMEGADLADIYYPAFLTNGDTLNKYPEFKGGEKVRLRIINGSASSQFWLTFGGSDPLLVAADGLNVQAVEHNKTFIAIAETYDFIVTIPEGKAIEMRAMAQDGSGHSSTIIGDGEVLKAKVLERPDKIKMMQQMANMNMRMGAPAMKFNPSNPNPKKMMRNWGMQMHASSEAEKKELNHSKKKHNHSKMKVDNSMKKNDADSSTMKMSNSKMEMTNSKMESSEMKMDGMDMKLFSEYNYNYLKSTEKTDFNKDKPRKDVLLNLTGNMWRYIWSMNGVPLSKADKIKIEKGQVVRITLNNLTMMHHPMHLHGHFFRVVNENGEYSPLKHTVNVAPMEKITIEFDAVEDSDWFFHCHVLYHMMSGMARIYSYDSLRNEGVRPYSLKKLTNEGNHFYTWAMVDAASHLTELNVVSSNTYNQFNIIGEYGWNENFEFEVSYERYLYDYLRVFVGVNAENEIKKSNEKASTVGIAGIRFFTPYMFNLDARIDNQLRPEIRIGREIMIFPRTVLFGNYEYQMDFGWVNELEKEDGNGTLDYKSETTWSVGMEYFLSRNFSLMGSYDNRFGAGGGLSVKF
ncbi:MAG: multicopper oxidase domain-containing protein [Vicingaceae bacterium]